MEAQDINALPRRNLLALLHRTLVAPVVDFIYPPVCISCSTLLERGEAHVCDDCWSRISIVTRNDATLLEITRKLTIGGDIDGVLSCFLFEKEGPLQSVVHALKYSGVKSLGRRLGRELGARIEATELFRGADYLVPVPLHRVKHRERGYNQAMQICRGASETSSLPVLNSLLIRKRYTQSQTTLSIDERAENVRDAFDVRSRHRSGVDKRRFILVDDVITTGATIGECARVLRKHGAASVLVASIALAP